MFREACAIARSFTWPVVLSHRSFNDKCNAGIGTLVVLNDKGWILTAGHILEQCERLKEAKDQADKHEAAIVAINADGNLSNKERGKKLRPLGKLNRDAVRNYSFWWGRDDVKLVDAAGVQGFDVAVARLEPFDPAWVNNYPVLKDPAKDVEPGVSLCKLGFPFHAIEPTWDDAQKKFVLPPGAVPLPFFPIEGILTRFINVPTQGAYLLQYLETSSPGLMGQSGGPIFDVKGTVWAIQSHTTSYPLDLKPNNPKLTHTEREHLAHQFLNVGRGAHVISIIGLLDELGVKYEKSAY